MTTPPTLQRITTRYIDTQDRVRLSGELPDGQTVTLWLTQRLLNRLVAHLCAWLDQQARAAHQTPGWGLEVAQSFAQEQARAALTPQAPVASEGGMPGALVHSVDSTATPEVMALVFKGDDGAALAGLELQATPLRQWLGIVHDQYRLAEWPTAVWPVWVEEARATPSAAHAPVLH